MADTKLHLSPRLSVKNKKLLLPLKLTPSSFPNVRLRLTLDDASGGVLVNEEEIKENTGGGVADELPLPHQVFEGLMRREER